MHARLGSPPPAALRGAWRRRSNDDLLAALPAGSLVVNATGLGKDRPGSPLTGEVRSRWKGIAWEFNYRGELEFLHQAGRSSRPAG